MRQIAVLLFAALGACASFETSPVPSSAETTPVPSFGDAADDPAIWIHPEDVAKSLVFGTDKQAGLAVYALDGREKRFLAVGQVNNVDVRQADDDAFAPFDVAAASHVSRNAILVFAIDRKTGEVSQAAQIPTGKAGPYGFCLGEGATADALRAAVTYRDGTVQLWRLKRQGRRIVGEEIDGLLFESGLEGCVFDEPQNALFV